MRENQKAQWFTESNQEKRGDPQGVLSHCPPPSLERIVSLTGTPASELATLAVQNRTSKLYSAVVAYAGASDPPEGTQDNLFVESFEEPLDSDSSSDSDYWYRPTYVAQKNRKEKKLPPPKYFFGLGETCVTWPPPSHLTAQALVAQYNEKYRSKKKNCTANGSDAAPAEKEEEPADVRKGDQAADKRSKDPDPDPKKIYLVHYSVGEPLATFSDVITYREILMVSPDGREVLQKFSHEVMQWQLELETRSAGDKKFRLYRFKLRSCDDGYWHSEGLKRARPPSSVILQDGMIEAIIADIRHFLSPETKKWYNDHGLPHRRAFMFYGPPGTGKTSTIRVLASEFQLSCYFLSMTSREFSNQSLGDAMSNISSKALIVIEDVDSLFNQDRECKTGDSLTFSGLLNALDGVCSVDGIITIMTTNHFERLDKALVRGGRVDRRFLFDKPTNKHIEDLFRSFYPDASNGLAREFLEEVLKARGGEEKRSIPTLQQLFIDQRKSTAEECVKSVGQFFSTHFPNTNDMTSTLFS